MSCVPRASRPCSPLRLAPPAIALLLGCAHPALAQQPAIESPALVNGSLVAMLAAGRPFAHHMPPQVRPVAPIESRHSERYNSRRPAALPALYASFTVLQALDVHSTLSAVRAGATEANPAMRGLVAQPGTFVAAKLAASAATVYLTERLWKKHRTAAVVLMVALNATYGAIVTRNYRSGSGRR
jgi:hypothetical protein